MCGKYCKKCLKFKQLKCREKKALSTTSATENNTRKRKKPTQIKTLTSKSVQTSPLQNSRSYKSKNKVIKPSRSKKLYFEEQTFQSPTNIENMETQQKLIS
jgi:hypothetical protein